ncbi:MAG: AMP-binding protein [Rhodospirillales bacterium]|jgi:2,3-dihydroxybenzoate-AMP ligase|nr:AMP-binding protein [Rhodospirillales bacterium]
MLEGFTPWPAGLARRYRDKGYWEGLTLSRVLDASVERFGDREALVFGAQRITYRDLGMRVDRLAYHLAKAGLKPSDRVVLQLPNTLEFVYVFLALTKIGVIPVMALRAHRLTEIRHFVGHSGAVGYFIPESVGDFDYREMADEVRGRARGLEYVFVAGTPAAGQIALGDMLEAPVDAADLRRLLDERHPDPGDVALMLLSGGTTALPKLIPRTHDDYVYNFKQSGRVAGIDGDTVYLAVLPLAHNYSLGSPGMMATLEQGGTVAIATGTDTETVFTLAEAEGATVIAAAIPLITKWVNSDAARRYDLGALKVVQNGGARLAPELRRRLRDMFGCVPQEIYGTAEGLLNMVRLDDADEFLLHSSGAPMCPDDEIKVLDDDDNEVAEGDAGELVVRGPYTIQGYYKAPDINAAAFTDDGFYRMGDIVRRRGRYIFTEGRRKDLINRGGEKISCDEVESLILTNDKVDSVCLVAMPDEIFGEKACAFVILKAGQEWSLKDLGEFLMSKKIAKFKLPERLEVVDEFPISPVGKILRRELRQRIEAKVAAERGND